MEEEEYMNCLEHQAAKHPLSFRGVSFLLVLLFVSVCGHSQNIDYGVLIGGGYSNVTSKTTSRGAFSYGVGAVVDYNLKSNWLLHGELKYIRKGATVDQPEQTVTNGIIDKYEFHLNYLELPISVGYKIAINERQTITPRAGLYGAVGIGGYGFITSRILPPGHQDKHKATVMRVNPFELNQEKLMYEEGVYSFDAFQRPNIGAVVGVDMTLSEHFTLSLTQQMSLFYFLASYTEAGSLHFYNTQLSLSYFF